MPLVRLDELTIDPAQIDRYTAAIAVEIETSIRVEPGVLAIHAVAEKADPSCFRFFEIHADEPPTTRVSPRRISGPMPRRPRT